MEEKKQEIKQCQEKGCFNDALRDQKYCRKHLDDHWLEEYKSQNYSSRKIEIDGR